MKVGIVSLLVVIAVGLFWLAGEQHRKNCIAEGKGGCSALPWVNGYRCLANTPQTGCLRAR